MTKEEAIQILKDASAYISWGDNGPDFDYTPYGITLDGEFTLEQLEALVFLGGLEKESKNEGHV